ncbi:hypothetical protein PspLS_11261 [Pyricularia sp. CBS 133598]|nr:hypothetical protein PspLS_11261 [Pyricularia sp. CBS 133598]
MKLNTILAALPAVISATQILVPTVTEPAILAARQQPTPTASEDISSMITACASSFSARLELWSSLVPQPSALVSYYSERYRSVTDECGSHVADATAVVPEDIDSLQYSWAVGMVSTLSANNYYTTPPGCTWVYRSLVDTWFTSSISAFESCVSAYNSSTSAAAATASTATTTAANSPTETPANSGAAGRIGVSTGLYPTPAPIVDPRHLDKRQSTGSETCGYRTDAQFRPFACGSGLTCTNSNNVRACCTDCDHSTFATECLDRTHTLCAGPSAAHPMQLCCTDYADVPFCATYLWSTSTDTLSIYTMYLCESTRQRGVQILAAETRAPNHGPAATITVPTSSPSSWSTSDGPQPGSLEHATRDDEGVPVGGVVGGVLGGLAILGVLVLWAVVLLRRRQATRRIQVQKECISWPINPDMTTPERGMSVGVAAYTSPPRPDLDVHRAAQIGPEELYSPPPVACKPRRPAPLCELPGHAVYAVELPGSLTVEQKIRRF